MAWIKVFWLKSHPDFSYFPKQTGVVQSEKFDSLFSGGYITPLPDVKDKAENPLPADLPGRDILFEAGYDSIEKVMRAGNSIADLDLSGATVTKIKKYLAR
ncbi:MAG TPA: hypothetical protein PK727_04650 [Bacteroidales bacterium]|jgi:hypothetical protein|nr:hypothetical protein [Bacteroidales bacterium]HOG56598.1 hypothetical protein [Bacteroidales bacterium]